MDVMIDFETLSTDTKCQVLSIGLVAFDYTKTYAELYIVFNIEEQHKMGRVASEDTKAWWGKQSAEARGVLVEASTCTRSVRKDLERVYDFIAKYDKVKVWGNGSGFDVNILEDLFKQVQIQIPWKFWDVRDLRTFVQFVGKEWGLPKNPTGHNALSDAKWQAQYIISKMSGKAVTKPDTQPCIPPEALRGVVKFALDNPGVIHILEYQKRGYEEKVVQMTDGTTHVAKVPFEPTKRLIRIIAAGLIPWRRNDTEDWKTMKGIQAECLNEDETVKEIKNFSYDNIISLTVKGG
jgi:hypothetical protein